MAGFDRPDKKKIGKKIQKPKMSEKPSAKLAAFLKKVSTVGYLKSKTNCEYQFISTNCPGPSRKPTSNDITGKQGDPYFFKVVVTMTVQRGMKKRDGSSSRIIVSEPCDSKEAAKNAASQAMLDYFEKEVKGKIDETSFKIKFSK